MTKRTIIILFVALGILFQGANLWADDDAIMDVDDNAASFFGPTPWINSTVRILFYGDDYEAIRGAGIGFPATHSAVFTTAQTADISGNYHVYVRWTAGTQRATSAVYTIRDDLNAFKGSCVKDQRFNGGAWQFCDEVFLNAGRRGRVVLANENEPNTRFIIADAVRFVRQSWDSANLTNEAGGDFAGGNQNLALTSANTTVRSVSITAPSSGKVIVNASGYFVLGSTTAVDTGRCSITTGTAVDFSFLIITGERTANSMNWVPFAGTRGFNVSAGTTVFRLVCNEFAGTVSVDDSNMTAVFVPTTY